MSSPCYCRRAEGHKGEPNPHRWCPKHGEERRKTRRRSLSGGSALYRTYQGPPKRKARGDRRQNGGGEDE